MRLTPFPGLHLAGHRSLAEDQEGACRRLPPQARSGIPSLGTGRHRMRLQRKRLGLTRFLSNRVQGRNSS
jgi:hypothetical protein